MWKRVVFLREKQHQKENLEKRLKVLDYTFFVAENQGEIVGIINGAIINENAIYDELYENVNLYNSKGKYQSIFGLAVISSYRNQGIAARLMNYIIELSRKTNKKRISTYL